MSMSKPVEIFYELLGSYLSSLYNNPIRTKAVTSCVTAALGNYLAQKLTGVKYINQDSLMAFGLFGLLFGGTLPHYFYRFVPYVIKNPFGLLLLERLLFMPCYQVLALYMIARFEGKSHSASMNSLNKLYVPMVEANLKYLTLIQFINIRYVPPMLRVLVMNFVGVVWCIYLAKKREEFATSRRIKP